MGRRTPEIASDAVDSSIDHVCAAALAKMLLFLSLNTLGQA